MKHARVILWAQWRTIRHIYPRAGAGWTSAIAAVWYGFWLVAAVAIGRVVADPSDSGLVRAALPGGLLLIFLYWQVVPLLTAATGASLETRKLLVYPIPVRQLFTIEVLLRVTGAIEMLLVISGIAAGILANPEFPDIGALGMLLFIAFNLFLAVGIRDLLARLLSHKRIREIVFFALVLCAALPQLFVAHGRRFAGPVSILMAGHFGGAWPWAAAARLVEGGLAEGGNPALPAAELLAWCGLAAAFGLWQFSRTLSFDAQAAGARRNRPKERRSALERLYRLPSALFRDPLGALIEKEIRFLVRSPRFRLVFLMGFTFGLVIWLPVAFGRGRAQQSFIGGHYLTVVSIYSLMLLSEVCFWNSFGFDRSAAQIYFLAPVPFSRVLIGKNISALVFVCLEILAVTTVCALLGMPVNALGLAEAFGVAGVVSIFLLGAGNLMSVRQARGVNPDSSFRSGAAGRIQAVLFVVYPIAFIPAGLAYLARWAFDSQAAFFAVLAFDAAVGAVIYHVALESAVELAGRSKEKMIAALSVNGGPIAS